MKKILIPILTISFLIALLALISSWIIDYNLSVKTLIYKIVFCLLGTLYIINGFSTKKNEHKVIFILCGVVICGIGFIQRTLFVSLLGVITILTPIIIGRLGAKPTSN